MEPPSSRDQALLRELAMLKRMNSTVANLTQSIRKTSSDIEACKDASDKSLQLIDKYSTILRRACTEQKISEEMDEYGDDEQDEEYEEELERQILALDQENVQLTEELEKAKHKRPNERSYNEMGLKRRKELGLDFREKR
ncbi:hypothetical protein JA1_003903 [Spathaspora sp. JA1]|nr:hypothetical protein JA1_003903 [Spathaspora sp. JA1]